MVVGFIVERPGVFGFVMLRPWGQLVQSGPLVRWGVPLESLGSYVVVRFTLGVIWFILDIWVHSRSLGSLGCSNGGVRFRWVHRGVLGFWVQWGAPWVSSCSLGFVRFIVVRPAGRRIHSGSFGSLWRTLGVVMYIRVGWVHRGAPWGSSDSVLFGGFIVVCPGVRSGSLDSVQCGMGVVGFVRGRWVQWGAPWESFGVAGFSGVRTGGRRISSGLLGSVVCALAVVALFGVAEFSV